MLSLGVDFFPLSFFYYFLGTSNIVLKIIWDWDRMMRDGRKSELNIFSVLAHIPHSSKADRLIWNSQFFQVIAYAFDPWMPPLPFLQNKNVRRAFKNCLNSYIHIRSNISMAFNKSRHTGSKTLYYLEQIIWKWEMKMFSVWGILKKQNMCQKVIILFLALSCTIFLALET